MPSEDASPPLDDCDDLEIVALVRRGKVDAFRVLVGRYEVQVFRLLRNLVSNQARIEDLAQDVFLAAFTGLPSFDASQGRFSSWLLTIAKHHGLNERKKHREFLTDHLPETPSNSTPADDLVCTRLKRKLDATLAHLPDEQHTTFVLAEILGLSSEEIAEIEGCTHSTIRSRLSRAKATLLKTISTSENEP